MAIPKKPRKCRVCKADFQPQRPLQNVCCPEHALIQAKATRAKAERIAVIADRKVIREKKDKAKTITQHAEDTQKPVNAVIRYRDKDKGCISCGKPLRGVFHAGHYKPVGRGLNWSIRYHHDNIFGQCVQCNTYMGGNQSAMREGVLLRIGEERLAFIEGPQPDAKFTVEQLKQIAADHRQLLKELKNG